MADVEALSVDLKAVKGKLDTIMSLLLSMAAGGKSQTVPGDPAPRSRDNVTGDAAAAAATGGESGGGGGATVDVGAQTGNTASFGTTEPRAATSRGGYGQWQMGAGSGSTSMSGGGGGGGSIRRGGRDPYAHGGVLDYRPTPRDPIDRQHHGWHGHLLHSRLPQQPHGYDAGRYSMIHNQVRKMGELVRGSHGVARDTGRGAHCVTLKREVGDAALPSDSLDVLCRAGLKD